MVETQAQPARSLEEPSLPEMVEEVPEAVKTVFRPPGVEELEYREMVGTVLAPICCLEVGGGGGVHPRPVSREGRAGGRVAQIMQGEPEEAVVVAEPVVLDTQGESAASEQEAVVQ